ncbi:MAG TPA: VanZ family protein [Gemmatimonadaceae bacterium]|nr:VanZ family protein [Gemmatimonadaceae bacterium]
MTSVPGRLVPRGLSPYDKVVHFSIYAVFAFVLARDIAFDSSRWRGLLLGIAAAVVFAACDEWHQSFIGRDADIADWRADAAGATAGAVLWAASRRHRRLTPTSE